MKKYLILIFIHVLIGCSGENNKKKINQQENRIKILEKTIEEQKVKSQSILDSLLILEKIKQGRDSLSNLFFETSTINLLETSNSRVFSYSKSLHYSHKVEDEYWNRGVIFTSPRQNEELFNVKVSVINDELRFFFLGVETPLKVDKPAIVNIYELATDSIIHKIDSFDLLASHNGDSEVFQENINIREFILLQLDNLQIINNDLFYYKVSSYSKGSPYGNEGSNKTFYAPNVKEKKYYKYKIGTKSIPHNVDKKFIANYHIISQDNMTLLNPDKTIVASNNGEGIFFKKITNWHSFFSSFYKKENYDIYSDFDYLQKINFAFSTHLHGEDDLPFDRDTNSFFLIGGVNWHTTKNKLYFDNSGMGYRCIWEIDLDNNKVTKIVPEHDAIHPFFFKINDNEYIIYTEKNKIMICESGAKY